MRRILFNASTIATAIIASLAFTGCSSSNSSGSGGSTDGGLQAQADSGGADSGGGGSQDAGSDASGNTVSCDAFCAAVMKNCTGTNQQYADSTACLTQCNDFPSGAYGDAMDTVGCRQAHAVAAASNPTKECVAAGTFGGDVCGKRCDAFCTEIVSRCGGQAIVYNSTDQCNMDCGNLYKFDTSQPEYTMSGNDLNCREGWLKKVLVADPPMSDLITDCGNAGPMSSVCK